MIKAIISDFSRVILFPKDDNYEGQLNVLHGKLLRDKPDYTFSSFFLLNEPLLRLYEMLKSRYILCIFTEGTAIQHVPEIKSRMNNIFQHVFTPDELALLKTDPRSYLAISEQLKVNPDEILFIDDRTANIDAARKVGLKTIQFFKNERLFEDLDQLGVKKN